MYDDSVNTYFQEEAHYYFTLTEFVSLIKEYGDRIWADLENYSPDVYESFCAYKANSDIEEFLSNKCKEGDCCGK